MAADPSKETEELLRDLVRRLAAKVRARIAFICERTADGASARTLALSVDGDFLENLEYKVAGTPCADVYKKGALHHPTGLTKAYPDDRTLAEWNVDSYVGVTFADSSGNVLGHLGVMSDSPLEKEVSEPFLHECATQAGQALERLRSGV